MNQALFDISNVDHTTFKIFSVYLWVIKHKQLVNTWQYFHIEIEKKNPQTIIFNLCVIDVDVSILFLKESKIHWKVYLAQNSRRLFRLNLNWISCPHPHLSDYLDRDSGSPEH